MKKEGPVFSAWYILKWIVPFIWRPEKGIRLSVMLSLLFSAAMVGLNIYVPLSFQKIIKVFHLDVAHPVTFLRLTLLSYGFIWTFSKLISSLRSILNIRMLASSMRAVTLYVFNHLHKLSLRFHLERNTGKITSALDRAENGIEEIVWGVLLFMLPVLIEITMASLLLTYFYGPFYSICLLTTLIVYIGFNSWILPYTSQLQAYHQKKRAKATARLVDSLLNFETVKYFNNEEFESVQSEKALVKQEKAAVARWMANEVIYSIQGLIIGIGFTVMIWRAGNGVINGKLTLSDLILINSYALQFALPLEHFGYVLRQVRRGLHDMSMVLEIVQTEPEIKDAPDAKPLTITSPTIVFENVVFGYVPERLILRGISFAVPAGHTVALVGPSGAGKSSIIKLLFRFYDIQQGRILINGQDVKKVTQSSLHQAIAVVPQDTILFNQSLRYNIAYGNPQASDAEIVEVIKRAKLEAFIERLPDGLDTKVGERGLKLSGGEKQRVAIARALLKKPAIYAFDEATSALDTATEQEIQKSLQEISYGATTLIIAHRLSTIVHAHTILVLENGCIVEQGRHAELLRRQGLYAELWCQQAGDPVARSVVAASFNRDTEQKA